jgi:MFS family permease
MSSSARNLPWWRSLSREQWFVFGIASLAWLFDCLDQQIFNLARDGAMEDLLGDRHKATELGLYTTSMFLAGWALGGLTLGALGDRFGRARLLTISVLLYSLFTGLSIFSTSFYDFCLYRFLTGVGVGGVFGLAVALVADSVPETARAPALGLLQSLSSVGNISAGLFGMGISVLVIAPFGLKPWQALFLVGSVPALLSVFLFARLKEPERWVTARAVGLKTGVKFGSYASLLGDRRWRKNAWLGLVLCSAGIVGLWGIGNFYPQIIRSIVDQHLAGKGLSVVELGREKAFWSSIALLLQNFGAFFGITVFARIAQTNGRRVAFALALVASFLSTVLVFRGLREFQQIFWMMPLMGFGQLAPFGIYAIYLPELFPTSLRSGHRFLL